MKVCYTVRCIKMQSVMVTAQKGLSSCAATQVLSLQGTLAMTVPPTPRPVQPTPTPRGSHTELWKSILNFDWSKISIMSFDLKMCKRGGVLEKSGYLKSCTSPKFYFIFSSYCTRGQKSGIFLFVQRTSHILTSSSKGRYKKCQMCIL